MSGSAGTDLFAERGAWRRDPRAAFDTWLAGQAFRHSSANVYRAQWGHFLDWLALRRATLSSVDTRTVEAFIDGLDVRKPQRVRYLRLVERVLDHIRALELASTNPARAVAQEGEAAWRAAPENEPTGFLTPAERTALFACLQAPLAETLSAAARWRAQRDRALAAVFIGAGLKTGDALTLRLHAVDAGSPWVLLEAPNPLHTRRVRLVPAAGAVLDAWLDARRHAGLPGPWVFPGGPSGQPMHKATALRAIDDVIAAAGIADARAARASPQTLRNTFAAQQFEQHVAPETVGQWLGFRQPVSAWRLYRAWQAWREREDETGAGPDC